MTTESDFSSNPLNPYQSYVVSASAGSGKTYQLSQRYLRLVAAGADPGDILTVTFTRKAAAEMQERIFSDAVSVLANDEAAAAIDDEIRAFYQNASTTFPHIRPPRNARQAAEAILNFSQSLKIQTIDSLFQELVQRFPIEAGSHIPTPFTILSKIEQEEMHEKAYMRLFEIAEEQSALSASMREMLEAYLTYPDANVNQLRDQLAYLQSERLFLFELKKRHQIENAELIFPSASEYAEEPDAELVDIVAAILQKVGERIGKATGAKILNAVSTFENSADPTDLRAGVFKKDSWEWLKKVDENLEPHQSEALLQMCYELQRRRLNKHAQTIFAHYQHYRKELDALKFAARRVSFDDLSEGVYNLFHGEDNDGVRYYLFMRMSHLLVDEFQDTSRIQWDIFHSIANELLSGAGLSAEKGLQPTIFLVGDAKQSIYAFRQGDYRLLGEAAEVLVSHYAAQHLTMEKSWRSGQLILDQVNKLFAAPEYAGMLEEFQQHSTAELSGKPVAPPYGSFTLLETASGNSSAERRENEAMKIVTLIQHWLSTEKPIYDKNLQAYRPMQFRDIGVLYRRSVQSDMLEKLLIRTGLPYIIEEKRGYYKRREVEDVAAFLSFLAMPHDNIALATVLRSPILRMSDQDLMTLLAEMQKESQNRHSLFELLKQHQPAHHELLQKCLARIGIWSIDRIVLHFLEQSKAFAGYAHAWGPDEGRLAKANLSQLIEILGTMQPQGSGSILEYRDQLKQFRGVDETGNAQMQANSVTLMTMHKAKGLEFPVVFLIGAEEGVRGNSSKLTSNGFKKSLQSPHWPFVYIGSKKSERLPEIAEYRHFIREAEIEESKEGMRLLYVAMTRAQQHFIATASETGGAESYYTILQTGIFGDAERHRCEIVPDLKGQMIVSDHPAPPMHVAQVDKTEPKSELYIPDLSAPLATAGWQTVYRYRNPLEISTAAHPKAGTAPQSLAEKERRYLIDRLVHRGLRHKLINQKWQIREELESAAKNSAYPFSDSEIDSIEQSIIAHIDNTWQNANLQNALTAAEQIAVQRPILYQFEQTIVEDEIDLLLRDKSGYTLVEFKTDALIGNATPDELLALPGYHDEVKDFSEAVAALYQTEQLKMVLIFTEAGTWLEL